MAAKEQKAEAAQAAKPDIETQELKSIDELCKKHKIGRAVFAGACAVNGWRPGKAMTDKEFLDGVAKFTKGPASGPGTKESEAKK